MMIDDGMNDNKKKNMGQQQIIKKNKIKWQAKKKNGHYDKLEKHVKCDKKVDNW